MGWRAWLYSILTGAISGASTSALSALTMPDVFNFTHDGWVHMGKLSLTGAIVPVLTYLKQSPLPTTSLIVTSTQTKTIDINPK